MVTSISSKSDSIQVVYDNYLNHKYSVNRKYQRKLVWTQNEKIAFLDSILNNYSVPLFLLAQNNTPTGGIEYEIIDGMQRLNAIVSFIENEFPIEFNGKKCYFDLDTLASTLSQRQNGTLNQQQPSLPKSECLKIVSYQIPFSFIVADESSVEEIFRRINSFGKQLSNQEIRQAGATGQFSDIVRVLSTTIRGDVSTSDRLSLNDMKSISLSNIRLSYGIDINDIWWVKQRIITPNNIRVSRDEELIAWLVAYVILRNNASPSSKALNRLYRFDVFDKESEEQAVAVERKINEIGAKNIIEMFCNTFSQLLNILHTSRKDFCGLIYPTDDEAEGLVRSFQIVFLSLFELIYLDKKEINDIHKVIECLEKAKDTSLSGIRKAEWTQQSRFDRINTLKGLLMPYFRDRKGEDVSKDNWSLQIDNIMRLSTLEGSQYDFKTGFHDLHNGTRNVDLQEKCIKTLIAAVNKGPHTSGYVLVGITEGVASFNDFQKYYNTDKGTKYQNTNFYVTGIDDEVKKFYDNSFDRFQNEIISVINRAPIEDDIKHFIATHIKFTKYYDRTILVLELESKDAPVAYNDSYFERQGNNVIAVTGVSAIKALEARFK